MAIRDWFRRREQHAIEPDVPIARAVSMWQANRALPKSDDYQALAEDGYRRNSIVFACIRQVAESVSEPDLTARVPIDGEEPMRLGDDSELMRLLNRPNPVQGQFELLDTLVTHKQIAGDAYLHKVRNGAGKVSQLWPLRPDRVAIVVNEKGEVKHYEHKVDPSLSRGDELDPADVIHFPYGPDPLDDYHGLSPLVAAARMGDLDNQAVDMLRSYFLNGGVPLSMLKLKGKVPKAERERLGLEMKEKFGGLRGWFNWLIGDADIDVVRLGLNPDDLDLSNVFSQSETRIAMTFGVPPILISSAIGLDRSTYANYREARRAMWEGRLTSIFTRLGDKLTHGLAPECDAKGRFIVPRRNRDGRLVMPDHGLWIEFDLSDVDALQEGADSRRAWSVAGWQAGLLTRNEARAAAGLPAMVDGDVFRTSLDGIEEPAVFADAQARTADAERELMEAAGEMREWLRTVNGRAAA